MSQISERTYVCKCQNIYFRVSKTLLQTLQLSLKTRFVQICFSSVDRHTTIG